MNTREAKRVLEAALVCSREPLPASELAALFAGEATLDEVRELLDEIGRDCADRGVELKSLASGFRFQSRPELAPYLARLHPERPPRFSRAVLETLAIIAFRQPVTRGDIEDIRGVQVASGIVKQLEDRGWVEAIGYRESPGRPALLATTKSFLDDLGLQSLDQLPALDGVDGLSAALAPLESDAAQPSQAALALETEADPPGAAVAAEPVRVAASDSEAAPEAALEAPFFAPDAPVDDRAEPVGETTDRAVSADGTTDSAEPTVDTADPAAPSAERADPSEPTGETPDLAEPAVEPAEPEPPPEGDVSPTDPRSDSEQDPPA